jgi:hypothetical protein
MATPCERPRDDCKYRGTPECLKDTKHHLFFPSPDYTSPLEKVFRNLPQNIVELSRCEHDELHLTTQPPTKPSPEDMARAVFEDSGYKPVKVRKLAQRLLRELGE